MSLIHSKCEETDSQERPIILTFRFWNSGARLAARANSVVHTGVKSAGCENSMAHL